MVHIRFLNILSKLCVHDYISLGFKEKILIFLIKTRKLSIMCSAKYSIARALVLIYTKYVPRTYKVSYANWFMCSSSIDLETYFLHYCNVVMVDDLTHKQMFLNKIDSNSTQHRFLYLKVNNLTQRV